MPPRRPMNTFHHMCACFCPGCATCVHANECAVPNTRCCCEGSASWLLFDCQPTKQIHHGMRPSTASLRRRRCPSLSFRKRNFPKPTHSVSLFFFFQVPAAHRSALQLYYMLGVVHYAGAGTSSSLPLPIVNPLVPSGPLGMRRRCPSPIGAPGALGADLEFTNLGGCARFTGFAAAHDA